MISRETPSHSKPERLLVTEIFVSGDSEQEYSNYKRLVARVVDAFADEVKASRWLSTPNADLDGETPLQVAQKDGYRAESVEPILIRIEHGIYD